jgi:glycosyltransferase involved in cell wall biosynthesis
VTPSAKTIDRRRVDVLVDGSPLTDARRTAGIGRYAASLLEALADVRDIEVTVTRPRRPSVESWGRRFLSAEGALLPALSRRPDVVHSLVSEPLVGWPLARQVVTVHDAIPWTASPGRGRAGRTLYLAWQRRRLQRCGAILAVSDAVAHDVVEALGVHPSRVRVVPEGVAATFSARRRADDRPRRVAAGVADGGYAMWVGSLRARDPRKRLDCLIDALARLDGSAPALVLAGAEGDESSRIVRRARALGVRVQLTGYVPDATLAALYRGAGAVLLPSDREGFGLPLLEAMACGTPVIASSVDSLPDLVGDAGVLVPAGDVDALARAVAHVAAAGELRERLAAAGPARASRYSWRTTAALTAAVYREVAAERRDSSAATSSPT